MKLTEKQAYLAMYYYLENLYELTQSDDLGGLLGGMGILEDGTPADPACLHDWHTAIQKALKAYPV